MVQNSFTVRKLTYEEVDRLEELKKVFGKGTYSGAVRMFLKHGKI